MGQKMAKIIVIVGPTASGKSVLAVELAKKFGGEIISADSRQVYRGLDIGTAKITKKEMRGVPHHLLDVANSKKRFSVAEYQHLAKGAVSQITGRGKLPIVCGGTGLYVDSILYDKKFPEVPPNAALRKNLEKKSVSRLFAILKKLDRRRANEIDANNPVRLIRAIEIARALGKVPPKPKNTILYRALIIGLTVPSEKLRDQIRIRLFARISRGMVNEARKLHKNGLSWKQMERFGLEYRNEALYLQGKISKSEMMENILRESYQYSRRQMTWFRKNKEIVWMGAGSSEIEKLVKKFLK